MAWRTKISGTLTVPSAAKALKIEGQNNYDESTDTDNFVPVSISSVNVPAGKKLSQLPKRNNNSHIDFSPTETYNGYRSVTCCGEIQRRKEADGMHNAAVCGGKRWHVIQRKG